MGFRCVYRVCVESALLLVTHTLLCRPRAARARARPNSELRTVEFLVGSRACRCCALYAARARPRPRPRGAAPGAATSRYTQSGDHSTRSTFDLLSRGTSYMRTRVYPILYTWNAPPFGERDSARFAPARARLSSASTVSIVAAHRPAQGSQPSML